MAQEQPIESITTTTNIFCTTTTFASTPINEKSSTMKMMLDSPGGGGVHRSPTMLYTSPLSNSSNSRFKSQNTLKMLNQSRVRAQASPYSLAEHHTHHHHHHHHHHHNNNNNNAQRLRRGSGGTTAIGVVGGGGAVVDSSSSETEADSSSTNNLLVAHPTTPVSSLNESSSAGMMGQGGATAADSPSQHSSSSLAITALLKKQDLIRGSSTSVAASSSSSIKTSDAPDTVAHMTTPVTVGSSDLGSSPTSSMSSRIACGGGVSTTGATVEALTRSTSLGSLSSAADDVQSIKSSYSSAASSCINGIMTPAYSELPDSPGGSPTQHHHYHHHHMQQQQQQQHKQHQQNMQPHINLLNYPIITANFDPAQFQPSFLLCNRSGYGNAVFLMPIVGATNTVDGRSIDYHLPTAYATANSVPPPGPHNLYYGHHPGQQQQQRSGALPPEEISVLTVDSNSKSNDITVVERTMLTGGGGSMGAGPDGCVDSNNKRGASSSSTVWANPRVNANTHATLHTSMGSSSSAYHSGSSSFLVNNSTISGQSTKASPWSNLAATDGSSGGGCGANQIQQQQQTMFGHCVESTGVPTSTPDFHDARRHDLTYMRKLLATQAATRHVTPVSAKSNVSQASSLSGFQQISAKNWPTGCNNNNFTPPVKLQQSSNYAPESSAVNRALFRNDVAASGVRTDLNESEMLIHYNDGEEEDDDGMAETGSMLSLPSVVKAETERLQRRPLLLDQLYRRAAGVEGGGLDGSWLGDNESSSDQPSYSSPCMGTHHMVSLNTSENQTDEDADQSYKDADFLKFIEENFKRTTTSSGVDEVHAEVGVAEDEEEALADNSTANSSSDVFLDELDENVAIPDMQQYANHVNRRVVEAELVAARMLPKIEEEESEDERQANASMNVKKLGLTKRLSTSSIASSRSIASTNGGGGGSALAKVVLTKTARLRMAQKFKEADKEDVPIKSARPIAKPVMRLGNSSNTFSRGQPVLQRLAQKANKLSTSSSFSSAPSSTPSAVLASINTNQFNKNA